jgi:hypothetical protein
MPHPIDEISASQVQKQVATEMGKFSVSLTLKLPLSPLDHLTPVKPRLHSRYRPSPRHRQPPPIRRKPRRQPLLLHPPNRLCPYAPSAAQHQAAASIAAVDLVHGLHQADTVFGHVGIQVQRQLLAGGRLQVNQHHAMRACMGGAGICMDKQYINNEGPLFWRSIRPSLGE